MNYNIEALLQYGRVFSKKQKILGYIGMVILGLFPLYIIFAYFLFRDDPQEQLFVLILTCFLSLVPLLGFCGGIVEIKRDLFRRKLMKKCMLDTNIVELNAEVESLGGQRFGYQPIRNEKIRIYFSYQGKKMIRDSKKYYPFFTKYVGKTIRILYSPQYDEVMILKD